MNPKPMVPPPTFVRANFTFSLNGRDCTYLNQPICLFGVSSLHPMHHDPMSLIGQGTSITADVLVPKRFSFTAPAQLTAETTRDACYLGLKFNPEPRDLERLRQAIATSGYCPTHYLRKYPRIPASPTVPSMPLRAIVNTEAGLMVCDIANISPNGILLYSESPSAGVFFPDMRLEGQVEPRGESFQPFEFQGVVCRIVMEKNPETGNVQRYIGIRLMRITKSHQENFLAILRAILDTIQKEIDAEKRQSSARSA